MTMTRVVTYETSRGSRMDICRDCEARLTREGRWPRDGYGEEYAKVYHGEHAGSCQIEDCRTHARRPVQQ